ncbi:unnamed protein product [Orchesella dallaii]|uniref:Uncharacterized protein n=1 Tax=Orchesella dallaii TaxID=48710 RepID=A0ABP1QET3_9HEXA
MKRLLCSLVITIALGLLSFKGIQAQKHKGSKTATTPAPGPDKSTLAIPFLVQPGVSHSHIDKFIMQNSSLPFSVRFGRPSRTSSKFHYPALPTVYWTTHKKPEVPLVEPEQELGFGFD